MRGQRMVPEGVSGGITTESDWRAGATARSVRRRRAPRRQVEIRRCYLPAGIGTSHRNSVMTLRDLFATLVPTILSGI